jgi:hypothetical protein
MSHETRCKSCDKVAVLIAVVPFSTLILAVPRHAHTVTTKESQVEQTTSGLVGKLLVFH